MTDWSFTVSGPWMLLGLVAWLAAGAFGFIHWRRRPGHGPTFWLESLRFVIITLLLITLMKPERVQRIERTETPEIVIMADASASMETRDLQQGTNVLTRRDWLEAQQKREFWKPLEKDARVSFEAFAAPPADANAADPGTDLNAALEGTINQRKNLKTVILLTDGDWTAGKSPLTAAARYREQGVPVFSVTVGRDTPLPDLVLEQVKPPAYGLVGEQISIPFRIKSHLPREVKTTLVLREENGDEIKRPITIPALGDLQDSIIWSPRIIGDFSLKLQVPVEADEALPKNNEQSIRIAVRSESLKVLVVDSQPRWEYRYLRNALARDPGVELSCVLFHPDIGMGGGNDYLPSFPGTKEQLAKYDVVFLGDVGVGEGELKESDLELLRGLVEQQSSGLVFLPGRRGRQLSLVKSPVEDLMPVVWDITKPNGIALQNEANFQLSNDGTDHFLMRFEADDSRNAFVWKNLPGFFWSAAIEKSRPGAEVLAVHSSLRNKWGRVPIVVTRPYGSGKVLFMGTDSAWRWRRGVEDRYHYRFWSGVVRWMAHQRHLSEKEGVRLTYSPEAPGVGETVFFQASILNREGFPAEKGSVVATVTTPSGRSERLSFAAVDGGWGVFKGSYRPTEGGNYKLQINSPEHGRELTTTIAVKRPEREKLGQPANARVLRELAALTQGINVSVNELETLVQQISLLPEPKPLERRTRLWAEPLWGGFILLLLGIYWTARKLAGMV
ncbi:MAG TPA: VWA domain-containing protein [Verrucomicrobiae bacterium]